MKSPVPFQIVDDPTSTSNPEESRVLIHAPSSNDASITVEVLTSAGITASACSSIEEVNEEISRGCAMLILAEEALPRDVPRLMKILAGQPAWSDLPIAIITSHGEFAHRHRSFEEFVQSGNIAEIERPFRPETLVSSVRVALRERHRQYQMRDLVQTLRNEETRIRRILESISDAFISIDLDWRIRFVNPAFMTLVSELYRTPEELVGHDFWGKLPDLEDSSAEDLYRRAMREQTPQSIEIYYGPLRAWLEIRAFPSPQYLSLYVRDITYRREAENQLRAAKERAEAANRSKDYFLAMLSHELRTPLTPVLMIASTRERDRTIPPDVRADMAAISRNVQLETELIDDLLDLSRIASGKISLNRQTVDFNTAVEQACETCKTLIVEQGVDLNVSLASDAGQLDVDPARLQQILWNILKNAIKFSSRGGTVSVATARISPSAVQCSIQDAGIGMDSRLLPRIFDAFEQGDARKTQRFGGLGLGLAITKALVDLHDGKIKAESEGIGRGSLFTVEFPISRSVAPKQDNTPSISTSVSPLNILLVEDHVDTCDALKTILESLGFVVMTANSGGSALEAAVEFPFDIFITDIGLPDLTGYELIGELKKKYRFEGIAMSGYGMEEDVRRSQEAGFSEHLVKPVSFDSIQQTILRVTQKRRLP